MKIVYRLFIIIILAGLCAPTVFHAMEQEPFMCKVPLQAEVKQKADSQVVQEAEWVSKTFNVPEQLFSVAVGKNTQGETIVLAGGEKCVHHIDVKTGTVKKFVLPGGSQDKYDPIMSLAFLPHNQFIAQSQSHVCLCDMQGNIIQRVEFADLRFEDMHVGIDVSGKFFACVRIRNNNKWRDYLEYHGAEENFIEHWKPFGNGSIAYSYNRLTFGKDEKGNLKLFKPDYGNRVIRCDASTLTQEGVINCAHNCHILPVDHECVINRTHNNIQMVSLKNSRCLHEMSNSTSCNTELVILSDAVDTQGRYITADRSKSIKIWDLKNNACTAIVQGIPVETYFSVSCNSDHATFQSVALNTRALGNCHFVSAAKDGTVKLWTNTKEAKKESDEAEVADFVYQGLPQTNGKQGHPTSVLTRMVCDYVGPDAHQALAEIAIEKQKQREDAADKAWAEVREQNRVDFVARTIASGLD